MLKVEVDAHGDFAASLQRLKDAGGNLTLPFTILAKSWFKSNESIFLLKGPGKYIDLSPAYKKQKIKPPPVGAGFLYPILKKTGALAQSITNPSDINAINLIVNKVALYLGSRIEYGPYHQSPGARRKIPLRPFVLLGAEQVSQPEKRVWFNNAVATIDRYYQQIIDREAKA